MRVQIEFNENGEIRSVAGSASIEMADGSKLMISRAPRPGHTILDVEVEDVQHDRDFEGLQKVVKNYRVTGHPKEPRLALRDPNGKALGARSQKAGR